MKEARPAHRRELCDAAIKMQSRSLTKAGAETVIGNIDTIPSSPTSCAVLRR